MAFTPDQSRNNVKSEFHAPVALPSSLFWTIRCFCVMVVMLDGTSFVLKVPTLCLPCPTVPGFAQLVLPLILFHLPPSVHSGTASTLSKIVPSAARKRQNGMPFSPVVFTIACVRSSQTFSLLTAVLHWLAFLSRTRITSHGYANLCTIAIDIVLHRPAEGFSFWPGVWVVGRWHLSLAAAEQQARGSHLGTWLCDQFQLEARRGPFAHMTGGGWGGVPAP